MTVNKRNR